MFSKFLSQSDEKKDKIINASIKEFAQKGYTNASTNQIVKTAEISKGLLFHYFGTKKNLYTFLFDYCVQLCFKEFFGRMDLEEPDIFVRLEKGILIKMDLLNKYPEIIEFLQIAIYEESEEVKNILEDKAMIKSSYQKMFSGVDYSLFKEGIDLNKAINIITWTFDGFTASEIAKAKAIGIKEFDYTEIYKEVELYIQVLKKLLYK